MIGHAYRNLILSLAACLLALPLALSFAEDATEKPAKPKMADKMMKVGGVYGKLDLSEDQNTQILAIQADTNQKIKALREEETQQIDSLLDADQKEQVEKLREEGQAAKAAKKSEKPEKVEKVEKAKKVDQDEKPEEPDMPIVD